MRRHRLVRVPASSANLGPGYDALAAALSPALELEVVEGGDFEVVADVPGVPLDRSNLCVRAFEALHPADGLRFEIRSEIPPAAGLGSSAAAIVAGLVAADHMFELDAPLFERAAELEGHPDNVAAALLGAREGVFCEPASAASVAGLLRYGAEGTVVCVLTGHGLKDPQTAMNRAASVVPCEPDIESVERAVLG